MKLFEAFDAVYVINLDSRPDRMMEFREGMRSLGMADHEIDEKIIRFSGIVPPTGLGALGCTLSHLGIVKHAKEAGYEKILVFEDDAVPYKEGLENMEGVIRDLQSEDWEIYYLGYNSHHPLELHSGNSLRAKDLFSTHAVAYKKSFFDRFIDDFINERITVFDVWLRYDIQTSMKCLASYPMLFIQYESYSDIEKKNVSYDIQIERYKSYTSHLPEPNK
jgi:GR25 family glycosyltransferase involved in LPS biosynthesis